MLQNLSYRSKTRGLYLILLLLIYLLYKKVFINTETLIRQTNELRTTMESQNGISSLVDIQQEMSRFPEPAIVKNDSVNPANQVLSFLARNGQVGIESFTPVQKSPLDRYTVNSFTVKLSGDFLSLLAKVDQLEKELKVAGISALHFYSIERTTTSEIKLYAEISLQYLTENEA